MKTTRTRVPAETEIIARINERKENDTFADEWGQYPPYVSCENAKPFFREGIARDEWARAALSHDGTIAPMEEYVRRFSPEPANSTDGTRSGGTTESTQTAASAGIYRVERAH